MISQNPMSMIRKRHNRTDLTRSKIIKEIWKYGMENPNFSIEELENFLHGKTDSEDDIHFGLAYVRINFHKNKNLDEYLIDQDSISNLISNEQWTISIRTWRITKATLIVSIVALAISILNSLFNLSLRDLFFPHREDKEMGPVQQSTAKKVITIDSEIDSSEYQLVPPVPLDTLQLIPIDTTTSK